ncbi:MAG: DUF2179 domain-containing protein [Deltaproteobacteria bacterium]
MIANLIIIFLLNAVSNCLGTLKTLFISKQMIRPTYFVVFSDALLFSYTVKMVSDSSDISYILAFALGKVFGIYLADAIEKKMAIGLLEITVYAGREKGKEIADCLRSQGYSVTTYIGYGMKGKGRLVINIIIKRKDYEKLNGILTEFNTNITMSVSEIREVTGKLMQNKSHSVYKEKVG